MHPDFWLVLLRFARPGLLAVFGTVPMALGIQLFVAFGSPSSAFARDFLFLALVINGALIASALPLLISEELPERWTSSRFMTGLRVIYFSGPIPVIAGGGFLLIAIPGFRSSSLSSFLREVAMVFPAGSLAFALCLGIPLAADHYRRFLEGRSEDSVLYRWRLVLLAHVAGLAAIVSWTLVHTGARLVGLDASVPLPVANVTGAIVLVGVMLWPVNLGLIRLAVDSLIEVIDARAEAAM